MVSLAPVSLPLLQSATCIMHEFWPDLEHIPLAPDDPQLQAEFSKILPASCALLLQGSRICYIRVDEVGGWVGINPATHAPHAKYCCQLPPVGNAQIC
jgi:hypothetical protein